MAGIGFKLIGMARTGGLSGLTSAASYGALISAGPWIFTIVATLLLHQWSASHLAPADQQIIQTILVYTFCLSAVAAAPVSLLAVRLVSDCLYAKDKTGIPALLLTATAAGTVFALVLASIFIGGLSSLQATETYLAMLVIVWLTQIWLLSPLLTAIDQYRIIFMAYGLGASVAWLALTPSIAGILAALAAGTAVTLLCLLVVFRRHFSASLRVSAPSFPSKRTSALMIAAGFMATAAIWVDKWMLWFGIGSQTTAGALRVNPSNDYASFLGLLSIVPGMTLIVLATETRFDLAFARVIDACVGTARYDKIEQEQSDLFSVVLHDLRLMVLFQSLIVFFCWVFAVPIFDFLGADTIGLFAFRHTIIGGLFHLIILQMCVYLAYYDLFGCILIVWSSFAVTSALTTALQWHLGAAAFGGGYMSGAIVGAAVAVTLALNATRKLIYLLFVGNNPSIVGANTHRLWI